MPGRFHEFFTFVRTLIKFANHVREVLVGLVLLVLGGGVLLSSLEDIPIGDGLYFACITGLTIGYGDITPTTVLGRALSIVIGLIGIIFTGITVAVATRAFAEVTHLWKKEGVISLERIKDFDKDHETDN